MRHCYHYLNMNTLRAVYVSHTHTSLSAKPYYTLNAYVCGTATNTFHCQRIRCGAGTHTIQQETQSYNVVLPPTCSGINRIIQWCAGTHMFQHQQNHTMLCWHPHVPAKTESYNVVLAPTCSSTNRIIQCYAGTNMFQHQHTYNMTLAPCSSTNRLIQCGAGTNMFQHQQNTYKSQWLMSENRDRLATDEKMIKHIHHINWEAQSLKSNKKIQMWKSLYFHKNGDNEGT
jgi:hypothetical protein